MKEDILAAQNLIKKQVEAGRIFLSGIAFSKYQKVYASTNENINGYVSKLNCENKNKGLVVLASGDHAFNLITENVKDIDTFDSNILTEYYVLGLKRAAILAFNYYEYLSFFNTIFDEAVSLEEITDLIKKLLPNMDKKYRTYWQNIIDYNYQLQKDKLIKLNLFHMLFINVGAITNNKANNNYLLDEKSYNKLKLNLSVANITFRECDCLDLPNKIHDKYDFIFLSNIADYFFHRFGANWNYKKLKEVKEQFSKLLNNDGVLALAYLIQCYSSLSRRYKRSLIFCSNISIESLTDEEILLFNHLKNNQAAKTIKDGIILERKR